MAVFLQDSFTDTAGTTLASHTPGTGGAWSKHSSSGSANASIDSTGARLQSDATTTSIPTYQNAATPPSADYTVAVDVIRVTDSGLATQAAGVMARAVNGASTYYWAEHEHNSGTPRWRLRKAVSGTNTTLGTSNATLTLNQVYRLELVIVGTSISLKVDGVTVIGPITDTSISAAGLAGVRLLGTNVYRLDNLEAGSGTAYTDAGQGTTVASAAGLDALAMVAAGQGASVAQGAGADTLTARDAGQATGVWSAGGADRLVSAEASVATLGALGAGADTSALAESGAGVTIATGGGLDTQAGAASGEGMASMGAAGLDQLRGVEAGQGTVGAVAAGLDTLTTTDAGQGHISASAGALDTLTAQDAGQGVLAASGAGADSFSGGTVYTDAGGATAMLTAAAVDALAGVDTGLGRSAVSAAGLDVFSGAATYHEAGGATTTATAAGADALVMRDVGGGLLIATAGGADSTGAIGTLAATLTPRRVGGALTAHDMAAVLAVRPRPTGALTPRHVRGTLTPRAVRGTLTTR